MKIKNEQKLLIYILQYIAYLTIGTDNIIYLN